MKKIFFILLVSQPFITVLAQTERDATSKDKKTFNNWSIEVNAGQNKAIKPFAAGYYSSDPSKYFNFSDVNHFDVGVRYMFSNKFGLKFDFASDEVKNQKNNGSLDFKIQQYRIGIQGVANLGRIMAFETFTNRFNILGHAGIQVSQLTPKLGVNKDVTEKNGGIIIGLTPQLRINNWIVLTGDFSALSNVRQHFNWDGSYSVGANNLAGMMYNASLGITAYLGNKEKHADWYLEKDIVSKDEEARNKIAAVEKMVEDTDKDGVPDYRDAENNTPKGVAVDAKGRYIDLNRNGIPDDMEKIKDKDTLSIDNEIPSKETIHNTLIKAGYINIFYDVNQHDPSAESINNIIIVINFLRTYPETKVKLIGYADATGDEYKNKLLSNRRAQKLYNILVASGIDKNRVSMVGKGVDKNYSSDSKTTLRLARRVSIILE